MYTTERHRGQVFPECLFWDVFMQQCSVLFIKTSYLLIKRTMALWSPGGTAIYGQYSMCRCEGYGFQAVYSGIGHINQRI